MKLLADENFDAGIVHWLRSLGHDVTYIAEIAPAISDSEVLRLARQNDSVVLSCDLDFGELLVRHREGVAGIVLLRLRVQTEESRLRAFQRHWPAVEHRATRSLVVVTDSRVRIRPLNIE